MNQSNTLQSDTTLINERLAHSFYASRRYSPLFLAVTGLGFIAIFLLTQLGILGDPVPQLLYIGSFTLLFAIAELPVLALAQQHQGVAATLYGSATAGLFAILLTILWQGIAPVAILIALATPFVALRRDLPRKYVFAHLMVLALTVGGILFVNANSPVERLQNNSSAAMASIVFLSAAGLLLATIAIILQNRKFQSIQRLLLTSFIIIVTISILMTAVLSALGAYTNSQTQTFSTLQAIATLKENQIQNLLFDFRNDTRTLLSDPEFRNLTGEIFAAAESNATVTEETKRQVRTRMLDVLGSEEEAYSEIMVLNRQGDIVVSTHPESEGSSSSDQPFFRQGSVDFFASFAAESSFGTDNLVVASPIATEDDQTLLGVLVLRSNAAPIKRIMENTPGFGIAETYLVNPTFQALTQLRSPAETIRTKATADAILNHSTEGKAIYPNYQGEQVLGYYDWFEPMQLAVVAEVPLVFVISNSVRALAGTALLGLFVIAIAVAAVAVSARTIADPITTLAQTTKSFAAGKLSVRAMVDREDEIGALANAYNQMASQLQETIGKLEQRVASRTKDLESQTLRLRVAAEIARDATSARELDDLLNRTAELIASRFSLSHCGIFLLDHNKEYAVLVAAPSEAGRIMLGNNYKVRVGETAIVGRVAATGEPRIAPDGGTEAGRVDNPYLPQTRSEMALPLRVESNMIGVLDVQSDHAQAFDEDDLAIMQVMADHLATAIERTRLLQEVERSLKELENAYGQFTRENWQRMADGTSKGALGYRFDNVRLEKITELPGQVRETPTISYAEKSNGSRPTSEREPVVAIPIRLRGQTIGVVHVKLKDGYDQNTISIIESAAERLASAMESARLYEEARLRADREQSISRVTTAISASTGYEQILQTTVREIGNILSDTEVAIQLLDDPTSGKPPQEQ